MNKIDVKVEVIVNPTEDPDKVRSAVENVVSNPKIKLIPREGGWVLIAEAEGEVALAKFYDLLRRERILDAARKVLYRGKKGNVITFYINKQVAFVGHVSFCEPIAESPLGPIKIEILCDDPVGLIDWLAPQTMEGR